MLMLKQILLLILIFYIAVTLFLFLQQKKFIFFPTKAQHPSPPGATEFTFTHADVTLHGWLFQEKYAKERLIIYYGGNAEDVYYAVEQFGKYGDTAALLVNYRGYGKSTGTPGEKELFTDALEIFDEIQNRYSPDTLFLMGRSLGSGVASYVASQRDVTGIILITPFDSIASIAKRQFPFLPTGKLLQHQFRSIDYAPHFKAPTLVIYGGRDTTVLPAQTQKLLEYIPGNPVVIFIAEAEHNNIELFDEYDLAILKFIQ
ncbi:MAG: alpha/beta hydrolase [Desulfocapsaceae bacterium]|nr:alpha/beta hydrolase [Desulfocapsaceae bacterium]